MIPDILPLIPDHHLYTEVFCGGGAIFWAKQPSPIEVINDKNSCLTTFYKVLKQDFEALKQAIESTLHSREAYRKALNIYRNPSGYSELEIAWAVFVSCNQSFLCIIGGGWAYQRLGKNRSAIKFDNAKVNVSKVLSDRLARVSVENDDALAVLRRFDCDGAFHYIDPPYIGTDCGHYGGYGEDQFAALLEWLAQAKGKWLLSSFDNKLLENQSIKNNWFTRRITKRKPSNKTTKVEVLTANYPI